jgi:alpha-L-arabinofuranosidase
MKLKATQKYHSTAISPRLASNFIELGYGLQVEGMAAELFFNRSFEPFYPYRMINKIWFDLLEDENDLQSRCETDWRVFDWYHSSYEHNAWFAFPGTAGYQEIRDDSTFVIEKSPCADVTIGIVEGGVNGTHAMRVVNNCGGDGGLAQDGKYCFPGVNYSFRGRIDVVRPGSSGRGFFAALYRENTVKDPVCVAPLDVKGDFAEVKASLAVPKEGRYTFALLTPEGSEILCDDFSLTPDDAIGGFKKSAVEAGRYVAPKVIRWPGGCFASFYNWRDGVGKNRTPMYSDFWGGFRYNDIGTDELVSYAEAVGGESMICVNLFHPFKRFYDYVPQEYFDRDPDDPNIPAARHGRDLKQFADKELGAREAAAWVEYCNGDLTTEGGRQRAANGREKPYNVKYWEMDNEIHRWFSAEEYADTCVMYSKAMKAVDPTIKIGMISYCHGYETLEMMLERAGEYIDFFADRGIEEKDLERKLGILRAYNEKHGTNLKYCNTEWLPLNGADVYNMVPRSEMRHNKCFLFSKWSYALDAAANMMMWQRHGDIVDFINFNNLANTHSQSVLETPKEGYYITAAGMMMHRFANTQAARTIEIENYHALRTDPVSVQLSENKDGSALVLNVLNRSEQDDEVEIDLSAFGIREGIARGVILKGGELLSMNRLNDQQITEGPAEDGIVRDGILRVPAPRLSFSEYLIEKEG